MTNLRDDLVTKLLEECDNIRRREASDIEDDDYDAKEFPYIDTNNYVDSVKSDNNMLIFGRRGCGKTSLLLKVNQENAKQENPKLLIVKDMQSLKNMDSDLIVCKLLQKMLGIMLEFVDKNIYSSCNKKYNEEYKGVRGLFKKILSKQNKDIKEEYDKVLLFIYLVKRELDIINRASKLEKTLSYKVTSSHEEESETNNEYSYSHNGEVLVKTSINFELLEGIGKSENDFTLGISESKIRNEKNVVKDSKKVDAEQEVIKYRGEIIENQKDNIISLINLFYKITKKRTVFMLDDFYQIKGENQPYIVQFFHDISKDVPNRGFRIKLFSIPGRIKLNASGVDMSYKDDFAPITIDTDISNIVFLIDHLSKMLSEISKSIDVNNYLLPQNILELFVRSNNDEVFTYLILASGAVPRDFIVCFREVILEARRNNQVQVEKKNIYSVVKKLRDDKDNNVENDASLSSETIDAIRRCLENDFAEKQKTNVFLYPLKEANDFIQETILRNLENLRYIYLIKDNLNSEKTKELCKAYMLDMSFCVVGTRKKNNFEIRKYWEKTEKSSLLRQSDVWTFPDSIIEIAKSDIEKTTTKSSAS